MLKAWVEARHRRGVDGFIINYFYRHNCLCEHCQSRASGLPGASGSRRSELQRAVRHRRPRRRTSSREIVGWHDPKESTPLRREMLRFSQISNKQAFDEVFVEYGRSLKPDLIVAQWNHLGDFSQINGDERCLLPAELWGRDEDYLWYSTGGAAYFTDLARASSARARCRPATSAARSTTSRSRSASTKRRASASPSPSWRPTAARRWASTRSFTDPRGPHGDRPLLPASSSSTTRSTAATARTPRSLLLFPRTQVHEGDVAAVEAFRSSAKQLLDAARPVRRPARRPGHARAAGRLPHGAGRLAGEKPAICRPSLSRFEAPTTVRVSASRPADGRRDDAPLRQLQPRGAEGNAERRPGIEDEKPLAVAGIKADLRLPPGTRASAVLAIVTREPGARGAPDRAADGRVRFAMPEFLVYGVARVKLEGSKQDRSGPSGLADGRPAGPAALPGP